MSIVSGINKWFIKSIIGKNGLPVKSFILAKLEHMVSWDSLTGEVKTIEYQNGSEISFVSFDECANIDPKILENIK